MAAINFQRPEKELQINQGWFLQNGGCGYVLKPSSIRTGLLGDSPGESAESFQLKVSVILGRHLNGIKRIKRNETDERNSNGMKRRTPTNTVVKVEIFGHPVDCMVGFTDICQVTFIFLCNSGKPDMIKACIAKTCTTWVFVKVHKCYSSAY